MSPRLLSKKLLLREIFLVTNKLLQKIPETIIHFSGTVRFSNSLTKQWFFTTTLTLMGDLKEKNYRRDISLHKNFSLNSILVISLNKHIHRHIYRT